MRLPPSVHLRVYVAVVGLAFTGCTSRATLVARRPPASAHIVGASRGSACGAVLFGIIPLGVNTRVARAYDKALTSAPGSVVLMETWVRDRWYTVPGIAHLLCFDVVGTAVEADAEPAR